MTAKCDYCGRFARTHDRITNRSGHLDIEGEACDRCHPRFEDVYTNGTDEELAAYIAPAVQATHNESREGC